MGIIGLYLSCCASNYCLLYLQAYGSGRKLNFEDAQLVLLGPLVLVVALIIAVLQLFKK